MAVLVGGVDGVGVGGGGRDVELLVPDVRNLLLTVLLILLLIALISLAVVTFYDVLKPKHKEALTLWAPVLGALSTFMLVIVVAFDRLSVKVVEGVKKDETAANACARSKDRRG